MLAPNKIALVHLADSIKLNPANPNIDIIKGNNGGHGNIWYNSLSILGNHKFNWFPFESKSKLMPLPFNRFLAAAIYATESSDMPGPNLEVTNIISAVLAIAKKIMACIEYLKYLGLSI
jgi:hypothetical protein